MNLSPTDNARAGEGAAAIVADGSQTPGPGIAAVSDDDLWHIAGVVARLAGGSLMNVSQHECVAEIRAAFMDPDAGRTWRAEAARWRGNMPATVDPQAEIEVEGFDYPTTYADLARLPATTLWNRYVTGRAYPDARTAFLLARAIPFVVQCAIPSAAAAPHLPDDVRQFLRRWMRDSECLVVQAKRAMFRTQCHAILAPAADQADSEAKDAAPNGIGATMFHDAGAIARCSYCDRYSLDPDTLSVRDECQPMCECGRRHGWSGSFAAPGPEAQWSGRAPAATTTHGENHIPFNSAAECSPTLTQCPRCSNPHNACDQGVGTAGTPRAQPGLDEAVVPVVDEGAAWQKMQTAPKDGTQIIIRFPKLGNTKVVASFVPQHDCWASDGRPIFPVQEGCEWTHVPGAAARSPSA